MPTKAAVKAEIKSALAQLEDANDKRPLTFRLTDGTPKYVSVTIRRTASDPIPDEVVMINGQSWPSTPRPKGRRLKLEIHVEDNPDNPLTITVENGQPSPIPDIVVPKGNPGWIFSRLVRADWK